MGVDTTMLQALGLKEGASAAEIQDAYLRLTTQEKFQKVILGDEFLEKEFKKYHEAYATLLKKLAEADADMSYYPAEKMARFLFNSGLYHLIVHNYIKAGEKLEAAYKINRKGTLILIYLGILLVKRKNYYAAEKYFLEAVKIDPDNEDVWFYLAENYFKAGNFKKAQLMYEKAKTINPGKKGLALRVMEVKEKMGGAATTGNRKPFAQKLADLFKK